MTEDIQLGDNNIITKEHDRRESLLGEYQESADYKKKLVDRLKIADACNRSDESKVYAIAACKADPVFFINNFCWTPNDKYKQYHFPFILYPFQEDYINWLNKHIDEGKDALVEKSREMGVTWLTLTLFLWKWLFSDNFNCLIGSYKEAKVDNKTKDSLMGMLDYQIRGLPSWMMPRKFVFKNHRLSMKLINPENQNIIEGDTMNAEFSRGSRKTCVFLDEGAFWEYFQDAWDSAGDTTNCRITVSTPRGYNAFAMLRDSGIDKMTMHWRMHPLKDEKWYEYEKARRSDDTVAQELDISYQKSQRGRVYPEWDLAQWGQYPYDPEYPLFVSWDFGSSDDTAIIWAQKDYEGKIRIIDCYANNGKTIDFYVPFITGMLPSDGYGYTDRDLQVIEDHRGWPKGTHFGDPAGRFHNQVVNFTVLDVLRNHGIHINFKDHWKHFSERIETAKLLMRDNLLLNDIDRIKKYLHICMINSKYPELSRGGMTIINSKDLKPMHDSSSHFRSSFEYLALGLSEYEGNKVKIYDKFNTERFSARRPIGY